MSSNIWYEFWHVYIASTLISSGNIEYDSPNQNIKYIIRGLLSKNVVINIIWYYNFLSKYITKEIYNFQYKNDKKIDMIYFLS